MRNRKSLHYFAAFLMVLPVGSACQQGVTRQDKKPTEKAQKAAAIAELRTQATAALQNGQYVEAFQKASEICQLDPNNLRHHMFLGSTSFAAGKMNQCIKAYDEVIRMDPTTEPYLWQRGLALYYADRFEDGVRQFEAHHTVNPRDVENAVWHLLCAARIADVDSARKKLIPITGDARVPMFQIYEMFAGRMTPELVLQSADKIPARAKSASQQQQLQLYDAHLYSALYHEMLDDRQAVIDSLKKAEEVNPMDKANFMGQVARVHLSLLNEGKQKE